MILLSIIGIIVSIIGRANPEIGEEMAVYLKPVLPYLITLFCLFFAYENYPIKSWKRKKINPTEYIKTFVFLGFLIFYWLNKLDIVFT